VKLKLRKGEFVASFHFLSRARGFFSVGIERRVVVVLARERLEGSFRAS
jgi:hypothetical protein